MLKPVNIEQPVPQVIERVIVKTEQIETIKILKTLEEYKAQLLSELKAEFEVRAQKPRVELVLPRVRLVESTEPLVDENGDAVLDENGEPVMVMIEEAYDYPLAVDGGRTNKDDFKTEWEMMPEEGVTTVRDADNAFHYDVTKTEMETIWKAIAENGRLLYQWKWSKEAEITQATTIQELEVISW
ncbi:hypothetical protein [Thiomicrorhabdus indica]|uniref:hypothetical protein n=1 Tax=Thiomicrorhabdus indica TaxID=2267253 RepID=UPI002AA9329A|nr:hypothetical protein [Thiomicrorhabdus indica]